MNKVIIGIYFISLVLIGLISFIFLYLFNLRCITILNIFLAALYEEFDTKYKKTEKRILSLKGINLKQIIYCLDKVNISRIFREN